MKLHALMLAVAMAGAGQAIANTSAVEVYGQVRMPARASGHAGAPAPMVIAPVAPAARPMRPAAPAAAPGQAGLSMPRAGRAARR